MVGRPILRAEESISETIELKDIMCGDEAAAVRQTLEIKYPVSNGLFLFALHLSYDVSLRLRTVSFAVGKTWNTFGTTPSTTR
jgi:hypothetical protein